MAAGVFFNLSAGQKGIKFKLDEATRRDATSWMVTSKVLNVLTINDKVGFMGPWTAYRIALVQRSDFWVRQTRFFPIVEVIFG